MGQLRRIEHDEFMAVAKALYGEGAWEIVKSREPKKKKESGLSNTDKGLVAANAASAGLGAMTLPALARDVRSKAGRTRRPGTSLVRPKPQGRVLRALKSPKAAVPLAGAALAGQVFNVSADAASTKSIADKRKKPVAKKDELDPRRKVQLKALSHAETAARKLPKPMITASRGSGSFKVEARVSKALEDKRQVYGWASITEVDGKPVVDLQGDYVTIEEIEKAAHAYISKSRKGGDMHLRDGEGPKHVADLIESVVITPEKKEALGLPANSPTGWWVGFQVHDDATWDLVKKGDRPMFSIHGSGRRQEVEIEA